MIFSGSTSVRKSTSTASGRKCTSTASGRKSTSTAPGRKSTSLATSAATGGVRKSGTSKNQKTALKHGPPMTKKEKTDRIGRFLDLLRDNGITYNMKKQRG